MFFKRSRDSNGNMVSRISYIILLYIPVLLIINIINFSVNYVDIPGYLDKKYRILILIGSGIFISFFAFIVIFINCLYDCFCWTKISCSKFIKSKHPDIEKLYYGYSQKGYTEFSYFLENFKEFK